VFDARQDRVLNTLDQARLCEPVALAPLPPCVLVLGVATDVGKTTAAAGLIHDLAQRYSCAAVKASGTGWYEDSLLHQQAGAIPALNFTFAGLPTTYYIPQQQFLNCMYRIMNYTAAPERIPEKYIHPDLRHRVLQKPNVIVVEHGGDFVWASIPYYLQDSALMASVRAIILCSESAMSLTGALDELESLGIINSDQLKVFASVPLINIEGFYKRIERHIQSGRIAGVFDINKPVITDEKDKRCDYSAHYDQILSRADLTRQVERAAGLKQS
jgi:dethiobiotin synthetase